MLPKELTDAISKSRDSMLRHPLHDLALGYRRLIWATFGPVWDCRNTDRNLIRMKGLKRRTELAILAALKVKSFWERSYPENPLPDQAVGLARHIVNQTMGRNEVWTIRDRFWWELVDIGNRDEGHQIVQGAGFSAVQALTAALRDEIFDPDNIDLELTDDRIDPDMMDSSFFAAATYANGAFWDPEGDRDKRREFWEWWLAEAVPAAWETS